MRGFGGVYGGLECVCKSKDGRFGGSCAPDMHKICKEDRVGRGGKGRLQEEWWGPTDRSGEGEGVPGGFAERRHFQPS